jgi:hypothetical protein
MANKGTPGDDEDKGEDKDERQVRQCSKLAAMRQVQFCTSSVDKIVRKDLIWIKAR